MLRFCGKNFVDRNEGYNVDVIGRIQMSGEGTWQEGKECFRRGENQELLTLQMVSVLDAEEEIFCYGWQDAEANSIPVFVIGRYWEYFGYQSIGETDDDTGRMVIMAESVLDGKADLFQKAVRSISPSFECIDKVYEANVLAGRVKNTVGGN